MGAHILAGIAGRKLDLTYGPGGCLAAMPGYGSVETLPLNTVDALLTPSGMLVHKDSKSEVRLIQVNNGRTIYAASATPNAATVADGRRISAGTIKASAITMTPGSIKLAGGTVMAEDTVLRLPDSGGRSAIADYIRKQIEQMVQKDLSARIEALEAMLMKQGATLKSDDPRPGVQPREAASGIDAQERSWGSQGGLPNFLTAVDDNPFTRRR